jgi:rhodanese-related sulfurtransferase
MLAEARSRIVRYLAAATLVEVGVDAGDLEGGFDAWVAAGLPVQ